MEDSDSPTTDELINTDSSGGRKYISNIFSAAKNAVNIWDESDLESPAGQRRHLNVSGPIFRKSHNGQSKSSIFV